MPGQYFQPIRRIFLNLSGGTVTGDTIFTQGVHVNTLTGDTIYSGGTLLEQVIYDISSSLSASTFITHVQPGLNITTAGTESNPIISVLPSPIFNNLIASGNTQLGIVSAITYYSGVTNLNQIINQIASERPFLPTSGGTGGQYYFTGNTTGQTVYVENNISPTLDNNSDLGSTIKRFRGLNLINGVAVAFTATTKVVTPSIELGTVTVTDTNIILTGNTLDGGGW